MDRKKSPLTTDAVRLLLASFLFFTSQNLLQPTFPLYVSAMGAGEGVVGLLAGVYALAAVFERPFFGKLADVRGRKMVLLVAGLTAMTGPLLYMLCRSLIGLAIARAYHAASLAAFITAAQTMLAASSQPDCRGKMFGYYGVASGIAMATGPGMGLSMARSLGYHKLFLASACIAGLTTMVSLFVNDPADPPRGQLAPPASILEAIRNPWVTVPSIALFCVTCASGAVTTFLPLHLTESSAANPGLYFAVFSTTSIGARFASGRMSDRYGRREVAAPAFLLAATGVALLTIMPVISSQAILISSALLFGLGFAAVHTVLLALITDKTSIAGRSQAVVLYANACDLGAAAGSMGMGEVARRSYGTMYGVLTAIVLIGFALVTGWLRDAERGGHRRGTVTIA